MRDIGFPTSTSALWSWTRAQYRSWSWEKWTKIPNRITSSAWLAERYAREVGLIKKDTGKKVVVVEWGAGTGAFAYRFLNAVNDDALEHYILCDLQADMPAVLSSHPQMHDYYHKGKISFYVSDVEDVKSWSDYLKSRYPGDDVVFVMVFNYMIDALPTDVWYASNEGEPVATALVMDGQGYKPWNNRKIEDIRFNLEVGKGFEPDRAWYRDVLPLMKPVDDMGAMYNVPVAAVELFLNIQASLDRVVILVCDIPMNRRGVEKLESPYFLDGMTASVVDFELLSHILRSQDMKVWTGGVVSGSPLCMASYRWGVDSEVVPEMMSLAVFWSLMSHLEGLEGEWSLREATSFVQLSQCDAWLLGALVDRSAGIDIENERDRALWLALLAEMEKSIFWTHGCMDWLHIATLYRWQKAFRQSYEALLRYAKVVGYGRAYWYCMGYWLFDQDRFCDAVDAWNKAADNDDHYEQLLSVDMQKAKSNI